MSIGTRIIDGKDGTDNGAKVDEFGSLQVVNGPFRPAESFTVPMVRFLTNDGTPTGSNEMAITTGTLAVPIEFWIESNPDRDRFITSISFFISGSSAALNEFGTGTPLPNGVRIYYNDVIIGDAELSVLKTNFDFVRLCDGQPAFGAGSNAFQVSNAIGTAEAFIPYLDLTKIIPPYGVKLSKSVKQRFVIQIRDDTFSARAVNFNCLIKGFEVI